MQINRNNFEAFFLDYWEGNLSEKDMEALTYFLDLNPDLQDAFYDYQEIKGFTLSANEKVVFKGKNLLKKEVVKAFANINNDNYETFVIASLEGDLSKREQNDFRDFVSLNPNIQKVIADYKKVYLKPPKNLLFQSKEQLKRKTIFLVQHNFPRWLGAAAAILIVGMTMFYIFLSNQPVDLTNQVAQKSQPPVNVKENAISPENNVADVYKNSPGIGAGNITNTPYSTENFTLSTNSDLAQTTKINNPQRKAFEEINQSDVFTKRESNKINPLTAIAVVMPFANQISSLLYLENREECSLIFDDLLLRDDLKANPEKTEEKKSAVERVFANLGSKIINRNNPDVSTNSLVSQLATKGKKTVSGLSSILPVYRTSENEGKKETYLAFSESFSIYRCKTIDEVEPEKIPNKH